MLANGAGQQFRIAPHTGMLGLRTAIEAARADREARGCVEQGPPVGQSSSPFFLLREAIIREQAEREARGPIPDEPAIYEDGDEPCTGQAIQAPAARPGAIPAPPSQSGS